MFADNEDVKGVKKLNFWEELSCGIYSMSNVDSRMDGYPVGKVRKHSWTDSSLEQLIQWERTHVEPMGEELYASCKEDTSKQHHLHSADSICTRSDLGQYNTKFSLLVDEKY